LLESEKVKTLKSVNANRFLSAIEICP
jgi:hypothetical protein